MHYTARKFEPIIDQSVIEWAEAQASSPLADSNARQNGHEQDGSFHSYWQNDYHSLDKSPSPNKAKLVFLKSVALLAQDRHLAAKCSNCKLESVRELNVYKSADGAPLEFLLKFDTYCQRSKLELLSKLLQTFEVRILRRQNESEGLPVEGWKLESLQVGTQFDLKEAIFRNYPGMVGPWDVPVVRHQWVNDTTHPRQVQVKAVWRSPSGHVRFGSQLEGLTTEQLVRNSGLDPDNSDREPMVPGVWRVEIVSGDGHLLGTTFFPVYPSEVEDWAFVKGLTNEFYEIEDICGVIGNSYCTSAPLCKETVWSSEFPDPKSDVSSLFERWKL